jgi:diguanylate cyclase (GGDEF)-like protein/PAS domain S-box-containing protein
LRFVNLKIWAQLMVAIGVALLIVWPGVIVWEDHVNRESAIEQARVFSLSMHEVTMIGLTSLMVAENARNRNAFLDRIKQLGAIRDVRVLRGRGIINEFGPGKAGDEANPDEFEKQVLQSGKEVIRVESDGNGEYLRAVRPVLSSRNYLGKNCLKCHKVPENELMGVVSMKISLNQVNAVLSQQRIYLVLVAIASFILLLILMFPLIWKVVSPLSRFAQKIDAMAGGREPLRSLQLEGSPEIRRLLGSFNKLQQHIGEQAHSLRDRAEQMRLAASVFEGTSEAILISSADNCIISVNRAFCKMTGYDESDLIGQNPRLLQSRKHDRAFYQKMWAMLLNTGQWQGEIWNRRKNGEIYPERLTISTLYDEDGKILRHIAIAADITEKKQAETLIWRQANFNLLTNLPNRRMLHELLQQAVEKSRREGMLMAILHVDLDYFAEVNDTLGHGAGDQLIIEAGRRISCCTNTDDDIVAHLGGDEFVVVLGALVDFSPRVEQVAEDILRAIAESFSFGSETIYISTSIGIARYSADTKDIDNLLKQADQAKHCAKAEGHSRRVYFNQSMELAAQTRKDLARDMRDALASNQFEVYYQPIVKLAKGEIVKAEALLRWHHPERGMVSPAQFIPIAEETGLISEIGDWVFKEAAQMARHWCNRCEYSANYTCTKGNNPADGSALCLYQVTVNKSPRQFFTGNTHKTWTDYLRENRINPRCITIEITEGLLLDQLPEVTEKFITFRDAGIQIALDDFGTGYSAMSYLKKFDIDYLKIDRSFIRDMVTDSSDCAIVEAIIVMAHKLGLKVVAEGIETIEQRDLLAAASCDYGQGYLFAKPMPAEQFQRLIAAGPESV